jgi:hypothetical protein
LTIKIQLEIGQIKVYKGKYCSGFLAKKLRKLVSILKKGV